jgi:hypothetical protein
VMIIQVPAFRNACPAGLKNLDKSLWPGTGGGGGGGGGGGVGPILKVKM